VREQFRFVARTLPAVFSLLSADYLSAGQRPYPVLLLGISGNMVAFGLRGEAGRTMETALQTPSDATAMRPGNGIDAPRLPRRSKTRKGKIRLLTLDALDARTAAAQSARKLIETLSSDLGGEDQLTAGEYQLVVRAAMTGAIVADFEARWVAGQQVPLCDYLQAVNVQRRVLATLGLQRRARDVSSTLDLNWTPLRARAEAEAAEVIDAEEATK
jgi:hypothetical protein